MNANRAEWGACLVGTTVVGLALMAYTLPDALRRFVPGVLLFLVLAAAAEAVHMPSRQLSIGFALAFPVLILHGPSMAAWVSGLGFILGKGITRRPTVDHLFGGARSVIAILAAAWVYRLLGGGADPLQSVNWFALSFISPTYFLVDTALVFLAECDFRRLWRPNWSGLSLDVAAHLVLTAFGLLLAMASAIKGWYGFLLVAVALAAVIHLMRLLSQLELANKELRILQETSHRLNTTLRLERVFDIMADAIAQMAGPEVLGLFLYQKPDQTPEMISLRVFDDKPLGEADRAIWREAVVRLAGDVRQDGDGRLYNNMSHELGINRNIPGHSLLIVPLVSEDKLVGMLAAGHRKAHHFDGGHLRLASIMSGQLAAAIENALLYEKTENMAITDSMTGLYNYRYFYVRLEEEVKRARSQGGRVSIIYMDLDRFKQYNDCFGHQAGDDVLKQFSEIVRESVRHSDIPARYAGDEFVVILPGSGREEAWEVVNRIEAAVAAHPFRIGARGILTRLSFSAGVACFPEDALTQDELIFKADKAMYEAKAPNAPGEDAG